MCVLNSDERQRLWFDFKSFLGVRPVVRRKIAPTDGSRHTYRL
jgi:hypothetical protein